LRIQAALLVIDVQVGFFKEAETEQDSDPVYQSCEILERICALIARAREAAVPVIYIRHYGPPGHPFAPGRAEGEIHPMVAPLAGETIILKSASDAFYKTLLQQELERRGVQQLVVTGCQTEYCIDSTCRRATSMGYDVVLVKDAHSTGDTELFNAQDIIAHHNATLATLANPDHQVILIASYDVTFV
jgi:nicotinamidase-related amidase